jgi:hypothetical protein
MDNEDIDYFSMSVRDSLSLMLWTSFATLCIVGLILAIAI